MKLEEMYEPFGDIDGNYKSKKEDDDNKNFLSKDDFLLLKSLDCLLSNRVRLTGQNYF